MSKHAPIQTAAQTSMKGDEEIRIAADRSTRFVVSTLDGLPTTHRVRGNADGTISVYKPTPRRNTVDEDPVPAGQRAVVDAVGKTLAR
jgi:hypothetical protein